jgi:Carbohydrate binding domain 30
MTAGGKIPILGPPCPSSAGKETQKESCMPEDNAKMEKGIKWWLRYVIVPLIGSGGLLGVYMTAIQVILPKPAQSTPGLTATLLAGTIEPEPTPTFIPTPTVWPLGDRTSSDRHSHCEANAAGLADPGRESAVVLQFKIAGRGGYCTLTTPLNGFNAKALTRLSFWIKGQEGGESFDVSLRDSRMHADSAPEVSQAATDSWSQVVIPLDHFSGLDTASLQELSLTIKEGSGALYVDRIEFLP